MFIEHLFYTRNNLQPLTEQSHDVKALKKDLSKSLRWILFNSSLGICEVQDTVFVSGQRWLDLAESVAINLFLRIAIASLQSYSNLKNNEAVSSASLLAN